MSTVPQPPGMVGAVPVGPSVVPGRAGSTTVSPLPAGGKIGTVIARGVSAPRNPGSYDEFSISLTTGGFDVPYELPNPISGLCAWQELSGPAELVDEHTIGIDEPGLAIATLTSRPRGSLDGLWHLTGAAYTNFWPSHDWNTDYLGSVGPAGSTDDTTLFTYESASFGGLWIRKTPVPFTGDSAELPGPAGYPALLPVPQTSGPPDQTCTTFAVLPGRIRISDYPNEGETFDTPSLWRVPHLTFRATYSSLITLVDDGTGTGNGVPGSPDAPGAITFALGALIHVGTVADVTLTIDLYPVAELSAAVIQAITDEAGGDLEVVADLLGQHFT